MNEITTKLIGSVINKMPKTLVRTENVVTMAEQQIFIFTDRTDLQNRIRI